MPNLIFHLPFQVNNNIYSGSQIRPLKMIEAFKAIGYNVDIIMGSGKKRKLQIESIKNKIHDGVDYDFVYSESSTMPTLLTERNHFPYYPFLDFSFLKYCKYNKICIALFYRDIHWCFTQYKKHVPLVKRIISKIFYLYDLVQYNKYVNILYLPNIKMKEYIPFKLDMMFSELPPAADILQTPTRLVESETISLLYVGGLGELYDLGLITSEIINHSKILLTIVHEKMNGWPIKNCTLKWKTFQWYISMVKN